MRSNNNTKLGILSAPDFWKTKSFYTYDFTNLTGADLSNISNGNAGLEDLSNNNRDATIINTPRMQQITINGTVVNTLEDTLTRAVSTGHNGAGIFSRNAFVIHLVMYVGDGQPSATTGIFGGIIPTNKGVNIFITSTGQISIAYGNPSGVIIWTTGPLLQNGITGMCYFSFWVNFDADDIIIRCNGESMVATQATGTIATINPASWDNTSNVYIATNNNNGTAGSNPAVNNVLFAAVTPWFLSNKQHEIQQEWIYERFFKWKNEIHHTTESDYNTLRATLIASVFNGGGLPALSPTATVTSYTGAMHICNSSGITGWATITKYTFATTDVDGFTWTCVGYLLEASATATGHLVINNQGHISDNVAAHQSMMSQLLAAGHDVVYFAQPITSADNTETNPTVTLTSSAGHNQILTGGLDRVGYNPLHLYFFEKTSLITILESSYTDIYYVGNSGGGWTTLLMAAMDTRINRSVAVRGWMPRSFIDNVINAEADFEQGGSMFTSVNCGTRQYQNRTDITYLDMALMATTGGRISRSATNRFDTCCFKGLTFLFWPDYLNSIAQAWGGEVAHFQDPDIANATHGYSTLDIAYALSTFS